MNTRLIVELCARNGITQKELTLKLGMKGRSMWHIIQSGSTTTAMLEQIAAYFGVHPGIFFDNAPEQYKVLGVSKNHLDLGLYGDNEKKLMEKLNIVQDKLASAQEMLILEKSEKEKLIIELERCKGKLRR